MHQMEQAEERVRRYEQKLDQCSEALQNLRNAVKAYAEIQQTVKELETYYTGSDWKADFEMDERGEFPAGLKRGVLSEDGIYSLLEENREWKEVLSAYLE